MGACAGCTLHNSAQLIEQLETEVPLNKPWARTQDLGSRGGLDFSPHSPPSADLCGVQNQYGISCFLLWNSSLSRAARAQVPFLG